MDDGTGGVGWYTADPRAVLFLGDLHVSRSLRQRVRSRRFRIRCDCAFGDVIRACARSRSPAEGTWINPDIIRMFELLHRRGHAHSVEAWLDGAEGPALVGGLYGLAVGRVFCGESMFTRPDLGGTDASKVCLVHLVAHLRARGFALLDCQFLNPHMHRLGAVEIAAGRYQRLLDRVGADEVAWGTFDPERAVREVAGT